MNTLLNYMTELDYNQTATLIHVASDAIRENISFAKAYENLGAVIAPIHNAKGSGIHPLIEDIVDHQKLTTLIIISAHRLSNMMKVIYS